MQRRSSRQPRQPGEILRLGGQEYRLESVQGQGGSAVVYRACYEDRLSRGLFHHVLIKELFPSAPRGGIWRSQTGEVMVSPEARTQMDSCRRSFEQGNQINLKLLEQLPEQISGNLNSYEAYGTLYSVLYVHGGMILEEMLEQKGEDLSLKEAAQVLLRILDALEVFHENGLLHLDVSPDNILMLPGQAMLIDYNSVWSLDEENKEEWFFSEKAGYTAPEVRRRRIREIGPPADLYAACAVFFRMVTGRRMSQEEEVGKELNKAFPRSLRIFQEEPDSAVWQAVHIARRGLHLLARKRYQKVAQMREDVEEMIRRIEGRGISKSALWESSRRTFKGLRWKEEDHLEQRVQMEYGGGHLWGYLERDKARAGALSELGKARAGMQLKQEDACLETAPEMRRLRPDVLSETEIIGQLAAGGKILLHGPGGMGKTSFLMEIWKNGVKSYRPDSPVTLYVPLADYQEAGQEPYYIRRFLLKGLGFEHERQGMEEAFHQLDQLLAQKEANCIILLDGLNEAGSRRENLLREIEEIGRLEDAGILVTDRTDGVQEYGLRGFVPGRLMELTEEQVKARIRMWNLSLPEDAVLSLLQNPMMLWLYGQTVLGDEEKAREGAETGNEDAAGGWAARENQNWDEVQNEQESQRWGEAQKGQENQRWSKDALLGAYLERLCSASLRTFSGDQPEQLRQMYLIRCLLPEIGLELKRQKRTLLTLEELYQPVSRSFRNLRSRDFSMAFPEFLGKSRLMLQGVAGEAEWFDYAVSEQLTERLNLLHVSSGGSYGLLHDNFIDYLADQGEENRKRIRGVRRKRLRGRAAAGVLAAALLLGTGAVLWQRYGTKGYSEQEKLVFRNAAQRLMMNVQILDLQLMNQNLILEDAGSGRVLDGDAFACQSLQESIERKLQDMESERAMANEGSRLVDALEEMGTEVPLDTLQELYGKSEEMAVIMRDALAYLEYCLCSPDSPYSDRNKREPLVEAYEDYLDAYARECYVQLSLVLYHMEPEAAQMVQEAVAQMSVMKKYILEYPLSGVTEEELENQLNAAVNQKKDAKAVLRHRNFPVDDGVW